MQATISGETARQSFCFKTNELLFVLSCIFICLGHKSYGILFLSMAMFGMVIRFGLEQNDRRENQQYRQQTIDALDQVANAHSIANRHKDAVH